MVYNNYDATAILRDINGDPIPQYYDTVAGTFKPMVEGAVFGAADVNIPSSGEYTGQAYMSVATQRIWLWSGTAWVEVV